MSAFQTAFEGHDQAKSMRAVAVFAAKIMFALALVITATVALVRSEVLLAAADHIGNADLLRILE